MEAGRVESVPTGVGAASSEYPRWHESGVSGWASMSPSAWIADSPMTHRPCSHRTSSTPGRAAQSAVSLCPAIADANSPCASPGQAPHEARSVEILKSADGPKACGCGLLLTRCRHSRTRSCTPSRPFGIARSPQECSSPWWIPHRRRHEPRRRPRSLASGCAACWTAK